MPYLAQENLKLSKPCNGGSTDCLKAFSHVQLNISCTEMQWGNSWTALQCWWSHTCCWGWGRCSTICSRNKLWRIDFSWKGCQCMLLCHVMRSWNLNFYGNTQLGVRWLGFPCSRNVGNKRKGDWHLMIILIMTCQEGMTPGFMTWDLPPPHPHHSRPDLIHWLL